MTEYDPVVPEWAGEPEPHDLVFCGDVMEHVEPECVAPVVDHIASLTNRLAIFTICMVPSKKMLPDGRNAHICLRHEDWWLSHLRRRFIVTEAQRDGTNLIAVCTKYGA